MAGASFNLLDTEGNSELNGYNSGTASEGKSRSPGNESAVLSENHSASSVSGDNAINPRRNSTGKPSPKPSFEKIVPHYLRASTGSCHDFCKYGRKHAFAEKESRPWRRRNIKAQSTQQNSVVAVALGERKKPTVLKHTWPLMRQNPALAAPFDVKRKTKAVKEITLPHMTQNPAVIVPSGEKRKAKVVKEITLPHGTKNSAVNETLGGRKKEIVHKQMASPGRKQSPPRTASLDVVKEITLPRVTNSAASEPLGERKKEIVHKQMALPGRKQSSPRTASLDVVKEITLPNVTMNPAVSKPLGERKKEIVPKQMVSSERKQSPPGTASLDLGKTARMHKHKTSPDRKKNPPLVEKKKATVKQITSPDKISVSFLKPSPTAIKLERHNKNIKQKVISPSKKVEASSKDLSSRRNSNVDKRISKSSNQQSPVVHPPPVKQSSASRTLGSNSSDQDSIMKAEMGEPENENVLEKTLHVIVTEPQIILSESTRDDKVIPVPAPESLSSPGLSSAYQPSSVSPTEDLTEDADGKEKLEGEIENGEEVKEEIESAQQVKEIENGEEVKEEIESVQQVKEIDDNDTVGEQEKVEEEEGMEEDGESLLEEGVKDDKDTVCEQEKVEEEEMMEKDGESSLEVEEEEEDGGYSLEEGEDVEVEEDEDRHAGEEDTDEIISDKGGKASNNDIKVVVGNRAKIMRKGSVTSESKDGTPVKIKFRRGRVVDLQSENSSPRRLRFRRARVVDEPHDHTSEIKRRSFKKKVDEGDESVPNPSNEKVVLKHQDAQGKKDAQGLFNNVIEETASKLVESRRSKVKALVGAFETVISLQDIKPSS